MGKPLMLLIRDGWGIGPDNDTNAVKLANTPVTDRLLAEYPNCTLEASGEGVGVRAGSQGSSEVGHLNMGAGRIVEQEIVRVDKLIRSGELFKIPRLLEAIEHCKKNNSKFHLMGLIQDQGVHAMQEHMFAFLKFLAAQGISKVCVHFFSDGRDTAPRSALTFLAQLEEVVAECDNAMIASVMGRYYSMDRALNWERVQKAYDALSQGKGLTAHSAREAIEAAYDRADASIKDRQSEGGNYDTPVETDEFIMPTLIIDESGECPGLIEAGDAVLHTNFRQDRAIQLTDALIKDDFDGFDRGDKLDIFYMGLTKYYDDFECSLLPAMNMSKLLGEVLASNGLRQLRIAEYQKYRHVTSFFNGKIVEPFQLEDRIQVESITIPEDQKPEMSAYEVTDQVLCAINDGVAAAREHAQTTDGVKLELAQGQDASEQIDDTYDTIMLNFANGDMVGHTGVKQAVVKAIETVDECCGKIVDAVLARGGTVLITADHGNSEQMEDLKTGQPMTSHTLNPVEFILVSADAHNHTLRPQGVLADISVTMLDLLGIPIPAEMTAQSLLAE